MEFLRIPIKPEHEAELEIIAQSYEGLRNSPPVMKALAKRVTLFLKENGYDIVLDEYRVVTIAREDGSIDIALTPRLNKASVQRVYIDENLNDLLENTGQMDTFREGLNNL